MFHKISIESLYSFYTSLSSDSVTSSGNKNICEDNTKYELNENSTIIKILDKNIDVLFSLEKEFVDIGYYKSLYSDNFIHLPQISDYTVTGETISRLDEITTYSGQLVEGLNFNNEGGFTGLLNITEEYAHYVFNAELSDGERVNETGVEYYTFFDPEYTFLKYYPKNLEAENDYNFYYKEDNTYGEYADLNIPILPEIDRGVFLNPMFLHETLSEINSLDDLQFSIFNI